MGHWKVAVDRLVLHAERLHQILLIQIFQNLIILKILSSTRSKGSCLLVNYLERNYEEFNKESVLPKTMVVEKRQKLKSR